MKFVIFGTGGVGGYFGGVLAHAGEDVWFIARGKHLDAMRSNGLRIKSAAGDFTVPTGKMTDNPDEIGEADVIMFCVKNYDLEAAIQKIIPILSDRSVIISLQNGVEAEEVIRKNISNGTVYGGVTYIYASISAPGEVTEWGGPRRIVIGPMDGAITKRGEEILDVFTHAGISAALTKDIATELWKKFIFISSAAGISSLARLTLKEILLVEPSRQLFHDAMQEVASIARKKGIDIPLSFVEGVFEWLKRINHHARTSMHNDLLNGKPLELEAFSGAVVRMGKEYGIPTPVHQSIYGALLPHHLLHTHQLPVDSNR